MDIYLEDTRFQEYVINRIVPFPEILKRAGISVSYQGNVFCCFHDNVETPAAKIYNNDTGDILFCFSERKSYRPVDVIKKGLINIKVYKVFTNIWKQLSLQRKEELINQYDKPIAILPPKWDENEQKLNAFKRGEISLVELLELITKLLYEV